MYSRRMILTFDLLTSEPMHVCLPSLVLIAQAIFLLEGGHSDRRTVTDSTNHPKTAAWLRPAWVIMASINDVGFHQIWRGG